MTPYEDALLLAAVTVKDDPIERFIAQLSGDGARTECRNTLRLVEEYKVNASRLLVETDAVLAVQYAEWLARHAREVAYRWAVLRAAVTRWSHVDCPPMVFEVPR